MKNKTFKTIIITGANQGLGFEIAKNFAKQDTNLILCGRTKKLNLIAKKKLSKIREKNIYFYNLDISDFKKVDAFYNKIFKKFKKIDILINNASIYGPKGNIHKLNWIGIVETININLLGSIYMTKKLIPHFLKKKGGKIIQLSGGGAASSFPYFFPYSISKVGIVRFIENLSEEYKKFNIYANSIAPGPINTRMLNQVLKAGPKVVGKNFYNKSLKQFKNGGTDINKIIGLINFLASNKSKNLTGKLISVLWDKWQKFDKNLLKIINSDVGTLRRIAGRDRKMNFFDK